MFTARRQRRFRQDVSLVSQWIAAMSSARAGSGTPVPYDQLPITQGTCSLICDALAAMDLYAVDEISGERVGGPDRGDTYNVLRQPNPEESRGETIVKLGNSLYWTGNAVALNGSRDTSGAVDAIRVVNPNSATHVPDPSDDLRVLAWTIGSSRRARSQVTHWKLNDDPRRGPLGESPLRRCATALDTYGWAYRYLADFFANGGNPSHTMRSKIELDNPKITELANEWVAARQERRPAFIPNWLEYNEGSGSNDLPSTIEALGFAAAEIARALNLPPSLANAPVVGYSLTYANTSDELRRWLALSLRTTWMARIERGFTTLLPEGIAARLDPEPLFDLFPQSSDAPAVPGMTALPPAPAALTEGLPA